MEEKNSKQVSKFFAKEDIEFLKKINANNNNLETILNQPVVIEDKSARGENVSKEKYK